MITWFGWTLIVIWTISALLTITQIGERRKPISPGYAVWTIIIAALAIWGTLAVGTGSLG